MHFSAEASIKTTLGRLNCLGEGLQDEEAAEQTSREPQAEPQPADQIQRFELDITRKFVRIQSYIRRRLAAKRVQVLRSEKSIPVRHDLQTHEGEVAGAHGRVCCSCS